MALDGARLADLVYLGQWVPVESSNVAAARYIYGEQKLEVEYLGKNGEPSTFYHYWPVTPDEVEAFGLAPSHGKWIWDHVRVRGTKYDHQKDYVRVL